MTTIVDVARLAGVSVSTVSHVINGTRRVSTATTSAVKSVIDEVGFAPNALARSLKTASTRSVGIAISAISNPYFSDIIRAVQTECARLGMEVFLSDTQDDPDRELAVVTALRQRRIDGLILAPSAGAEGRALAFLRATKMPCVLVDRAISEDFDQVGVNNREAMRALVEHVVARGHRRIGYVGGNPGFATTLERIAGYRDALRAAGCVADDHYVATGNATTGCAAAAAEGLLSLPEPPTALVAGNNLATIGVMTALRRRGLRVPRDVSVVGFDDFEWADCFEPRLTLVAQPCADIGRLAAELLMQRIVDPMGARKTLRLDAVIVERDSCGAPP
jgi:LacI family transcriptional regulator